jgi:3-hydroxyacyl-CoA dehydrogenase
VREDGVTVEVTDGIATVTLSNPPVNALSHAIRAGLMAAIDRIEKDHTIRGGILIGAGGSFIAGADIREFGQPPQEPHLPDVVRRLDGMTKPMVAAISGVALGGGLEVALGCSHRLATPDARLGLPEVNLGIIPGAGGTVLLPRVIPADRALEMIAGGKPVSATTAHGLGLVDTLVEGDLLAAARAFASEAEAPAPLIARRALPPADTEAFAAQKAAIRKKARGQRSPVAAIDAVERALVLDAAAAFEAERAAFADLRDSEQSAALRHVFFAERSVSRIARAKGHDPRPLRHIGIVGGGTMGAGIAASCLLAGLPVTLVERDRAAAEAAGARVSDILDGSARRGLLSADARKDAEAALAVVAQNYAALEPCDLLIEAVFEDHAGQEGRLLRTRSRSCARADAVLASNTSYLDIDEIASVTNRPPGRDRPALLLAGPHHALLEVIVGEKGGRRTAVATGFALARTLKKVGVRCGVCDGFIGNRVMSAYRLEADCMLEDGALPAEVDAAMRDFGFAMGIFQMSDLAGLDIAWAMRKRQAAMRNPAERYVEIADRLCEAGRLGRKTGKGWYDYTEDNSGRVDPWVTDLIEAESARKGIARQPMTPKTIMNRILGTMQAEGDALLIEGIAASPEAVDVVMVNGYGFPRWRGGPMYLKGHAA